MDNIIVKLNFNCLPVPNQQLVLLVNFPSRFDKHNTNGQLAGFCSPTAQGIRLTCMNCAGAVGGVSKHIKQ